MAPYVQSVAFPPSATAPTSPWTESFASSVRAGDLMVMWVCGLPTDPSNPITSVTDSLGGANWTLVSTNVTQYGVYQYAEYMKIAASSGSCAVTVNFTGSISASGGMILSEWAGINTFDDANYNYLGYTLEPNTTTLTTNFPGVAMSVLWVTTSPTTDPSGYTLAVANGSNNYGWCVLYYLVTASGGSQSASYAWSGDAYSLGILSGFYKKSTGILLLAGRLSMESRFARATGLELRLQRQIKTFCFIR